MLTLQVPITGESFDDEKQEFIKEQTVEVVLEHSLVSLSKWESRWETPFLSDKARTDDQMLDYIDCMIISAEIPPEHNLIWSDDNVKQINSYINAKMTATVVNTLPSPGKPGSHKEVVTSELLYYFMIKMGIYQECEHWHLNRLLMLIEVYNAKEAPVKKQNKQDIAARNRAENERRRAALKTRG